MMRKLPSATVALVCWSTRRFALIAAQPDLLFEARPSGFPPGPGRALFPRAQCEDLA
jgi:hypothetical protein